MDIISRLREFLDTFEISNSIFADSCSIPRPTVSQLLNGRNKKVSDEIISKIHATYPSLSMLWLLFGEGNMVTNSNIEDIKAKVDLNSMNSPIQTAENKETKQSYPTDETLQEKTPEISKNGTSSVNDGNITYFVTSEKEYLENKQLRENVANNSSPHSSVNIPADPYKSITNIVVFYSDNSFQSFQPAKDR